MEILSRIPTIVLWIAILVIGIVLFMFLDISIVKMTTIAQNAFNISQDVVNNAYTAWYTAAASFCTAVSIVVIVILILAIRGRD